MEMTRLSPFRGFSVRSILGFALAVIITALLWAILASPAAHAEDGSWHGDVVVLDGHSFSKSTDLKGGNGTLDPSGTVYQSPVQKAGTQYNNSKDDKLFILYFTPGVDPPTATSATYYEFTYDAATKTISNPAGKRDVTLTVKGKEDNLSSCSIGGVGWIICPISTFLAEGMDKIYEFISQFLAVKPLAVNDQSGGLYTAWNIMRNIANVAFVIAFLIIIYSQLTGGGFSNYTLKKLLPRLVVAAVLVNMSFIVSALAIDISNIFGYGLQQVFNAIRENTFHLTNDDLGSSLNGSDGWANVTQLVLAGGGVLGGIYYISNGGYFALVPILLLVGGTALLVAVVLAARQAIIIILVILSPLAFVANLLPNTEKWFDKWKDLFMTMLIFFPAFSLVFGGSQLAGQVIIQNAGDNIIMVIFGMAVQVAALAITPLLLKLSGGLLGRIAQIANNPNKGLIDRSRKWADDRQQIRRNQQAAKNFNEGGRRFNIGGRMVQANEFRQRRRKELLGITGTEADNRFEEGDRKMQRLHTQKAFAEENKKRVHNNNERHIEAMRSNPSSAFYATAMAAKVSEEKLETAKGKTTEHYNNERVFGSSALRSSSYALEVQKMRTEDSESAKTAYYTNQKSTPGTALHAQVESLETTKVRLEGAQSRYTATVEAMKLDPTNTLHAATITAQSSKEAVEAAQQRVQKMFDTERTTNGSILQQSMVGLEVSKGEAEGARAKVAAYLATQKSDTTTQLHTVFTETEQLKQGQQTAEAKFTRIIEEYKAGGGERRINPITGIEEVRIGDSYVSGAALDRVNDMRDESARLAAETQGASSAKYVQQEYVSTMMNESSTTDTAFTDELLTAAAGIDRNGKTRAQANASTQLGKLQSENLSNNVTLLGDMAEHSGKTIKSLAKEMFASQIGEDAKGNPVPQVDQDPSLLEAALEALAQDGDIPTMRKARMRDDKIDQGMMTRLFARNAGTMKAKGGFDLQNDPGLAGASEERMNASIAANLGSTSAANYPDMKNGEIVSTQENIMQIMAAADSASDPKVRDAAQEGLKKSYVQISKALTDPRIRERLGDNLIPAIEIHKALDARFSHNPEYHVTYDKIDPRAL